MPGQYTVPQFIDVEDKILGPLTTRQFVIILAMFGIDFLLYRLLQLGFFLLIGIPVFLAAVTLAFAKVNGQPFHLFLLNLVQTLRRPNIRVWNKNLSDAELRMLVSRPPPPAPPVKIRKEALSTSKLSELSLVVNTGGVYRPESE
ncbi:MAG: PrgI family protein [Patescibacteria group bacterium]